MTDSLSAKRVAILATDYVSGGTLMNCRDILFGIQWRAARLPGPDLEFEVLSVNGCSVTTYSGAQVSTEGPLDERHWDVIILPHIWAKPEALAGVLPAVQEWLKPHLAQEKLVLAMGCGVYWAAATGGLVGQEATTYWRQHDNFCSMFPGVRWQKNKVITESDHIICAAGGTAMQDVLLNLAVRLFGDGVARGISRDILFDVRRSYEFAPMRMSRQRHHGDRLIEQVQVWLESRYSEDIRLADVADNHGMSLRNFARRFAAATGEKPLAYLQRIRLEAARDLLVHSDKSIKHISLDVGYSDSSYFCRLFRTQVGHTPAAFRRQYKRDDIS